VQAEILDSQPDTNVHVYAVWMPLTWKDARSEWDPEILSDARVTHYWDEECVTGFWFSERVSGQKPVAWDAYFLYSTGATWEDIPGPLISTGHPIVAETEQLQADLFAQCPADDVDC